MLVDHVERQPIDTALMMAGVTTICQSPLRPLSDQLSQQKTAIYDAREIVGIEHPPPAAGAAPPTRGAGTPAAHPGRGCRGAPATPRPAAAPGRSRSARH